MYRTRGGTRRIQRGGDYVSTISSLGRFDLLNLPRNVTFSSLSALTAIAGISAPVFSANFIEDWTKLSVEQINAIIGEIDKLIAADGTQIQSLDSTIKVYQKQIDTDPNYQSTFDSYNTTYISVSTQYNKIQAEISTANGRYFGENSTLSSYYERYSQLDSTLQSYRTAYSTFLRQYSGAANMIDIQQSTVNGVLGTFRTISTSCGVLTGAYNNFLSNFITTSTTGVRGISTSSIILRSQITTLSTLQNDFRRAATSTNRAITSTISTSISRTNTDIRNTNLSLSTIVNNIANSLFSTNLASTNMGLCPIDVRNWSSIVSQNQALLNRYIQISTTFVIGSDAYWSSINYWSSLERQALSTIQGYSSFKAFLLSEKVRLNGEIDGLKATLRNSLNTFDSSAANFYSTKKVQLVNEVKEFQNAGLQLSAYLGWMASEYMIQAINLDDQVDTYRFYMQRALLYNNPNDLATYSTFTQGAIDDQLLLQSEVDNKLNRRSAGKPYDELFNDYSQACNTEIRHKIDFIDRRSTLTAVERSVLTNPSSRDSIKTYYEQLWTDMNTSATNANTAMNVGVASRKTIADTIRTNITTDALEQTLTNLRSKYTFGALPAWPSSLVNYPFTYNGIRQQDKITNVSTFRTTDPSQLQYALLPSIDFTAPIPNYSL